MDSLKSCKQPSAKGRNNGGGINHHQHLSGNNNASAPSQQQQERGERNNDSSHPLSSSSNVVINHHHHHFHDSFGDADSGVDYGPPIELEEDTHDNAAISIATAPTVSKSQHNDGMELHLNNPPEEEEDATTITLEELEETVGLREATLESLHDKLSKLNQEITLEEQSSSLLQNDIELLNKKKIVLKKRTENNVQLVKELEGTLEKCLERLRRVMDADDEADDDNNGDVDTKEEVKIDDEQLLPVGSQVSDENGHDVVMETEATNRIQSVKDSKKADYDDFEIIKMPISIVEQDKGSIAWPTFGNKDVKRVRKEAASLPFAFPVWRTSELSCALYTNLDSPTLLLDMMNTTILEHLLCREENRVDNGCGQVHESKIWGTSLDIMTQVKWEHLLPSLQCEMVEASTGSSDSRLDPNVQLCPYELGGTCADDRCPYQHLSRPQPTREEATDSAQDDDVIKYHSLSKLALPPSPYSDSERSSGDKATDAINDADLKHPPVLDKSDEELDPSVEPANQRGFEENDDYVSLPTVTECTDDQDVSSSNNISRDLEFSERFWWYSEHPFDTSLNGSKEESRDVFEQVVASFGFRRNCDFLEHIAQPWGTTLQKELIVDARVIDLCRVCVHMGQGSFALTVLDTFQKSMPSNRFHKALRLARQEVELSISSNSSQNTFETQLSLLVISKYIRAKFFKPDLPIFDLTLAMSIISGKKVPKRTSWSSAKKTKWREVYEKSLHLLLENVSRSPKRRKMSSAQSENNKWAGFEKSLHLMLEKEVIVPFSQVVKGEEYSYFLNCVKIGKEVENAVYELSQHTTFSPLFHALEPTWATLQPLLQTRYALSTTSDWLQPDLIVTVVIGPIIYACVSKTIAVTVPPQQQHEKKPTSHDEDKCQPKHDMRTIANMTCLDKCIVGILKALNKSSQENGTAELVELLTTPLHAISVAISMAVRMVDKAQMKLGYALSKGRIHRGVPSMYAMSSILWSQLIQLRITFPAYTSALRYEHMIPSLAKESITSHQDVVSRLSEHGVILHSIVLPGDHQITTSLLSTKGSKDQYKAVWEDVKREIYAQRSVQEDQKEAVAELDLVVANYMKEYSCFPETLLLAGGNLARLRMTNCGLKTLPMSFGFRLSNLQV